MKVEIITRKEALAKGLKKYFTGKPCKHGHVAERYTATGQCKKCIRKKSNIYSKKKRKFLSDKQRVNDQQKKKTADHKDKHASLTNFLFSIGYKPIDEYINARTPIRLLCENNHISTISPDNIKRGKRCKYCRGYDAVEKAKRIAREKKLYLRIDNTATGRVVGSCDICGHIINVCVGKFVGCKKCNMEQRRTPAEIIKQRDTKRRAQWGKENIDKIREYSKTPEYKQRKAELRRTAQYRATSLEYNRKWRKNNPEDGICRSFLSRIMNDWKGGRAKAESTLGYTYEQLKKHIESQFVEGMSWENRSDWHIDHIKPISVFLKEGIKDPAIINALSNLQPLWAKENLSKGAKWSK